MQDLKSPISKWERLFADQKETLMLYSFCYEFVSLVFEGDEFYTIVNSRTDASASEGWTAIIMERSSRFISPGEEEISEDFEDDQKHKRSPKRKKYQAPLKEHSDTDQDLSEKDIHANHVEANNAAMRRRNSAFRRRTNMYAKTTSGLQRTLDVYWLLHNFVRKHWTTGEVPGVAMGILCAPLELEDILMMQK